MKSEEVLDSIFATHRQILKTLVGLCDPKSEIEKLFLLKIYDYCYRRQDRCLISYLIDNDTETPNISFPDLWGFLSGVKLVDTYFNIAIEILPQYEPFTPNEIEAYEIERAYRLDFAFMVYSVTTPQNIRRFCIECDGFEYHRTSDQLKSDHARSRQLNIKGYQTLRFLGTEIFNLTDNGVGRFLMSFYLSEGTK
jgi:Protein of unknown function (DUF559)